MFIKSGNGVTVNQITTDSGVEHVVKIPTGFKYLNEVFTTFPDNSFLCKSVAGTGGTSLAITNSENYVIAGSSIELVTNKSDQHSNLIPVYGGIYQEDIEKSISHNKSLGIPIKIITTYDSLYKVVSALGDEVSEFKILVDELQVLLKASDIFKPEVVNRVFKQVGLFKSVCFMTATPTPRKYFPPEVSNLDYYRVVWEDSEKMIVNKAKIKGDMTKRVVAIALNHLDNGGTPIFFYNSLKGIIPCIKSLIKARGITYKDVKIICANTDANITYLKEQLGKDWVPEKPLYKEVDEQGNAVMNPRNKPIQFCTKYAFEGLDFYVEDAHTYVISDVKNRFRHHTRIDISTDLQQVAGRCRNQNPLSKRECVFLWNEAVEGVNLSEEEYEKFVKEELSIAKDMESTYSIERLRNMNIKFDSSPYFVNIDGKVCVNEYAIYGMCISYAALNSDYVNVMVDGKKTTRMEDKLDLFTTTKGFKLPTIGVLDKGRLNTKQSFKELAQEYYQVSETIKEYRSVGKCVNDLEDKLTVLESLDRNFGEIVREIGIEEIKSTYYNSTKSKRKYNKSVGVCESSKLKIKALQELNLSEGDFRSYSELKDSIQNIYDKLNLDFSAKATDIKEMYNVKRTKRQGVEGFLIEGKI